MMEKGVGNDQFNDVFVSFVADFTIDRVGVFLDCENNIPLLQKYTQVFVFHVPTFFYWRNDGKNIRFNLRYQASVEDEFIPFLPTSDDKITLQRMRSQKDNTIQVEEMRSSHDLAPEERNNENGTSSNENSSWEMTHDAWGQLIVSKRDASQATSRKREVPPITPLEFI